MIVNNFKKILDNKLGFGFMRLPLLSDDPTDIDYDQVNKMVDVFISNGFKYFETAYPYHNHMSETAIRKCLVERYDRKAFLLADKMPFNIRDKEWFDIIFNKQLINCGVEYFDFYLLHNLGKNVYQKYAEMGGFEYMKKLKDKDKVKYIGFSFHDSPEVLNDILNKHPEMEFVQLQLNYLDMDSPHVQAEACYRVAREYKKPIFVMEPVKGGALVDISDEANHLLHQLDKNASSASFAIRFAASLDGVALVLSGMSDLMQITDNTSFMNDFKPLNEEEYKQLDHVADLIKQNYQVQCTRCQYCLDECEREIPIPELMSIYNAFLSPGRHDRTKKTRHQFLYDRVVQNKGTANDCLQCGRCEKVCPQHIAITGHLQKIVDLFNSK